MYDDLLGRGFLEYTGLDADSIEARIRTLAKNIVAIRKNAAYEHEYIVENYDNRVVTRNLYTNFHKLLNESDSFVNVRQ